MSRHALRAVVARHVTARPARFAVGLLLLVTLAVAACGPGYMSANVGVVVPAPWGGVTVGTSVPIGYGW